MTSIALSSLAVGTGLAAFPASAAAATAAAPASEIAIDQPWGGPCGDTLDSVVTNVTVTGPDTAVQIEAGTGSSDVTILLEPPTGTKFTAGTTYTGVKTFGDATSAGVYLASVNGTGCFTSGTLIVDQFTTDDADHVTSLEARLDMGDPAAPRHFRALIRYNATGDAPDGAITGVAPVAPVGTVGPVGFLRSGRVVLNPGSGTDGSSPAAVYVPAPATATSTPRNAVWSPMGNRIVYAAPNGLHAVHPDGTGDQQITQSPNGVPNLDVNPTIAADGTVVFQRGNQLFVAAPDGSTLGHEAQFSPLGANALLASPAFAPDGSLLFTKMTESTGYPTPRGYDVYRYAGGTATLVIANAAEPVASPDGTRIAFTRWDSHGIRQVFTVGADGTSDLTQITSGEVDAGQPAWSLDGATIAYRLDFWNEVVEVPAAGGAATGSVPGASAPFFQPIPTTVHVTRVWGTSRIQTALAASAHDFADHGAADSARDQAKAIVLARSDNFADALGGSSLAVRKDAPLLITDSGALDAQVAQEMQRVLVPGGTVYLLGGNSALSPAVEAAVRALNYTVVRLSGADRFATSVQIAKVIDPNPTTLLIASGNNFPDALAAGATGQPLVLTAGSTMPEATAAYLNTLDPVVRDDGVSVWGHTHLVPVGGPGDAALVSGFLGGMMPHWGDTILRYPLVGNSRNDTALLVAHAFFGGESEAAFATSASWPDALSGGAMIGHRGGPLLLTDPSGLYGPDADFLSGQADTLTQVDVLGGPVALPDTISAEIAEYIGTPGHVVIDQAHGSALPLGTQATGIAPATTVRGS